MGIQHPAFFPEPRVDGPDVFFADYCAKVLEGRAEAARSIGGSIRFSFEDERYTLDLGQAKVVVSAPGNDEPETFAGPGQLELTMRSADFKSMLTGRSSLVSLVESGEAQISGDPNVLAALAVLLSS